VSWRSQNITPYIAKAVGVHSLWHHPVAETRTHTHEAGELSGCHTRRWDGADIVGSGPISYEMSPICNLSYRFQGKNSNKPAYGEQWENDKARESSEAFGQKHTAFSEICGRATSDNRSAWHVRHCTAEDGWLGREMPHTAETMG
jgi:hypothetical protein